MNEDAYTTAIADIITFLRALEAVQQSILFQRVGEAQRTLVAATGNRLEVAATTLDALAQAADRESGHYRGLELARQSLPHLRKAYAAFTGSGGWPEFGQSFLASRTQQCRALELLYNARATLPALEPYFRLDKKRPCHPGIDVPAADDGITRGLTHYPAARSHGEYSMYVPEYYTPDQNWPLIVALHGGYGRGDEYVWSWLRAARSRGYIVLAPKSFGPTWSIMQPQLDGESIRTMLRTVRSSYRIDATRVFLSGLSDGATFSFLFGLEHHEQFAALAPIAGVLSPMVDPMLRAGTGKSLPLHVIHGVHDAIFAVHTVRSTNQLLRSLNYDLTYTELPDWGHALTTAINETLVLPWFEQVHA